MIHETIRGLVSGARDGRRDGRRNARRDGVRRLARSLTSRGRGVGADRAKHFMKGGSREVMVALAKRLQITRTACIGEGGGGGMTIVVVTDDAREWHRLLHPRTGSCRLRWLTRSNLCTGYIGAQLAPSVSEESLCRPPRPRLASPRYYCYLRRWNYFPAAAAAAAGH